MAKTERIQLRISAETRQQLQQLADAENRSITNYIEWLVKREYEKKEKGE